MSNPVLPDTEAVMVEWAKNNAAITALVALRIATELPPEPTFPFLTAFRVGGGPIAGNALIDRALIQWDCWGMKTRDASLLARTLVREAFEVDMTGGKYVSFTSSDDDPVTTTGWVYGMEVVQGPRRVPEPETRRGRFIVETFVTVRGE